MVCVVRASKCVLPFFYEMVGLSVGFKSLVSLTKGLKLYVKNVIGRFYSNSRSLSYEKSKEVVVKQRI